MRKREKGIMRKKRRVRKKEQHINIFLVKWEGTVLKSNTNEMLVVVESSFRNSAIS